MALVSVIVPTRDRPAFLREALLSVEAQRPGRAEVVVVDDASEAPERTVEVVRGFEGRLDVRCVMLPARSGPSGARNAGAREARGEYLAFLDDDDLWHPGLLTRQLDRFRTNPTGARRLGVVYAWHQWRDARTGRVRVRRRPRLRTLDDLFRWDYNVIPTAMVRRESFERAGGFDESVPNRENLDLYARLIQYCDFDGVEEILVTCRDHDGPRFSDDADQRFRGLEMLLRRYEPLVRDRRVLHELRYRLGRHLLTRDRVRAGRELRAALALAPAARKPKVFAFWAIATLTGGRA